jgi:hypothetical protein
LHSFWVVICNPSLCCCSTDSFSSDFFQDFFLWLWFSLLWKLFLDCIPIGVLWASVFVACCFTLIWEKFPVYIASNTLLLFCLLSTSWCPLCVWYAFCGYPIVLGSGIFWFLSLYFLLLSFALLLIYPETQRFLPNHVCHTIKTIKAFLISISLLMLLICSCMLSIYWTTGP